MSSDASPPPDPNQFRPYQPRFGLGGLMLMMVVISIMAAGGYYYLRGVAGQRSMQLAFVLITIAAPLLLVVMISAIRRFFAKKMRK